MSDRIALLRAVLAHPTEDTPRLVYADWLDDNATSDADRARVELIRLWYSLKPNMRSTTRVLAQWLGANWPRLWPRVAAAADRTTPGGLRPQGRVLGGRLAWHCERRGSDAMAFKAYFDRGLAEAVQFDRGAGYERFWLPFAADEPVARFEPLNQFPYHSGAADGTSPVTSADFGLGVFDRLTGHLPAPAAELPGGVRVKLFGHEFRGLHPPIRAWSAVAAAMTARAREASGITEPV